jgi:hypothetical protein
MSTRSLPARIAFASLGLSSLALALIACSALPPASRPKQVVDQPPAATVTPPAKPQPAHSKPVPPPEKPPVQAKAQPAPAPERQPPLHLVGLTEEETVEALGPPTEESGQPPGKVWTYRVNGCELSVHLFPDMDRGGFYTLDYTAGEAPRDWCVARVVGEAKKNKG